MTHLLHLAQFISGILTLWAWFWRIPHLERQLQEYKHREQGCKLPYHSHEDWTCPDCDITWHRKADQNGSAVWGSETRRIR